MEFELLILPLLNGVVPCNLIRFRKWVLVNPSWIISQSCSWDLDINFGTAHFTVGDIKFPAIGLH